MSQAAPTGRATPRWSVSGQPLAAVPPASSAGLPGWSARVWVAPGATDASGASSGATPDRLLLAVPKPHEVPLSRLYPPLMTGLVQLRPVVLSATIVFRKVA